MIIPSDGTNCVLLGVGNIAGSRLSQAFSISSSANYVLSFDILAEGNGGAIGIVSVNLSSGGSVLVSQIFTNNAQTGTPFVFQSRAINFTVPAGITNATLTFSDLSPNNGSGVDSVLDNVRIVSANPIITSQPSNTVAAVGGPASFIVVASGAQPLYYQWQFNGFQLTGQTNSSLTFSNTQPTNAGNYSVVVSNINGSVTSSNASLTLLVPVAITSQPEGQSVLAGSNVTFSVSATGDTPLSYQWKFNGSNVEGATNSTLTLNNVQLTNAGIYAVLVSNPANSVLSSNASLSVIAVPVITTQPQSATVIAGTNITLSVGVQGALPGVSSGTLALWLKADSGVIFDSSNRVSQWQDQSGRTNHSFQTNVNQQPLFVASGLNGKPLLRFDGIQSASTGDFLQGAGDVGLVAGLTSFMVYSKGNRTSGEDVPAFIGVPGVNNAARAYYIPNAVMAFSGWANDYSSGFSIPAFTYRIWTDRLNTNKTLLDFFDTNGTNNFTTSRTTGGLLSPGSGYYVGGLASQTRNFQGDIAELIYYQGALNDSDRQSVENYLKQKYFGSSLGTSGSNYQWLFNGSSISGATNSLLTLTNLQPAASGNYTVIITNLAGSVTSAPAVVNVRYVLPSGNGQRLTNSQYTYVGSATISFQSYFANGTIFYTLDGSTLSFASRQYTAPFILSQTSTLRAITYSSDFSLSGESDPVNITIIPTYTLTRLPSGGGTTSVNTNGPYLNNTVVTVTATPSSGWTFLQWLGDATGTNPVTTVNMTRNKSVRAVFGTALNTTVAGNGAVTLYPSASLYPYGTIVRLTAIPQAGSYFGIWGNAASGNTNPLDFVVINPNPTISSLFSTLSAGQYALTVSPNGLGRVSVNPRANVYNSGQSVTLTATPDAGQTFLGWSGDATDVVNPLSVLMNQSRYITANFSKNPRMAIQYSSSTFNSEGFQIVLTGPIGEVYSLQSSSNLLDWSVVTTLTNSYGTVQFTDFPKTNSNQQYYRTVQP